MTLQQQIRGNRWRTLLLFGLFAVLIALILGAVSLVADPSLLIVVGVALVIYGVVMWFASGSVVASLAGASPITRDQHPELWQAVDAAAVGAGLPRTPDIYMRASRRAW